MKNKQKKKLNDNETNVDELWKATGCRFAIIQFALDFKLLYDSVASNLLNLTEIKCTQISRTLMWVENNIERIMVSNR